MKIKNNWIEPRFPKEQVKKAGVILISSDISPEDYERAFTILHNWRSSHAFPMQIMLDFLRTNALRVDQKALAVQRLKRVPSIIGKLEREQNMNLSRMEDIAGCRAVVSDVKQVLE